MIPAWIVAAACLPLLQVYDGEGHLILTWKAWQVFLFSVYWWNFS